MSIQDQFERILKKIHIALSQGETVPDNPEKVIVDKKEVLSILENLNIVVYEMMDQYEATVNARELAHRRNEKKGEELIERLEGQAEDVYAAALIYTDDAMNRVRELMDETLISSRKLMEETLAANRELMENMLASNQEIFSTLHQEIENKKMKVRQDQQQLYAQMKDFKDCNKYFLMIEECNKERMKQEKLEESSEKCIQNEAKHYALSVKPEIKVNPAYFQRRGLELTEDITPIFLDFEEITFDEPEIRVDLDAEYFKWQAEEEGKNVSEGKKEKKFTFIKNRKKGNK